MNLCLKWMRKNAHKKGKARANIIEHEVPGFGHRLYPDGDPRAVAILQSCPAPKAWAGVARELAKKQRTYPTLDFGLATLEHVLNLPKGAGFSIFAVGRTVGWLAHCFEQRKHGDLIRPRASG